MSRHERATLLDGSASAKLRAERANAIRLDQELARIKRNAKPRNKAERLLIKGVKDTNERARILTAERNRQRTRRLNPNGTDGLRYGIVVSGIRYTERTVPLDKLFDIEEERQQNRNNKRELRELQEKLTRTQDLLAERNAELRKLLG